MKILEDYSRQNENKSKELEALTLKLDKKIEKYDILKRRCSDQDSKVIK
jgi:lipase chaperone LimK